MKICEFICTLETFCSKGFGDGAWEAEFAQTMFVKESFSKGTLQIHSVVEQYNPDHLPLQLQQQGAPILAMPEEM